MTYETIIVETHGHVGLVRLDRPDEMNALNSKMMGELANALDAFERDGQIGAIVLTGSAKVFAAGADVREMRGKSFVSAFTEDFISGDWECVARTRKPVIAAVAGYALGGGCELALMCDIILVADNAKFGQPEINLGIIPGIGGTQRLTRLVGKSRAMDMILTGRFVEAKEAERSGLASRIFPADDLIDEAIRIADRIAEKSRLAVYAAKEAVHAALEGGLSQGILHERRLFHMLFATDDQTEGMDAFVEKREAQFRNR